MQRRAHDRTTDPMARGMPFETAKMACKDGSRAALKSGSLWCPQTKSPLRKKRAEGFSDFQSGWIFSRLRLAGATRLNDGCLVGSAGFEPATYRV
jgi:hypothetical protein